MRRVLANLGCLVLLILLLPLFIIFIGPLLALAAVRGRQPVGPIKLNTTRYGPLGRVGALLLGVAIWLLVWSSLAWVVVNGLLPASTVAEAPVAASPPVIAAAPPLDTPIPLDPPPPTASESGPSNSEAQSQAAPPAPTFTAEPTPESTPTPTRTPTVLVIIDPTPTPGLASTPVATATNTATPELAERQASDQISTQPTLEATDILTTPLSLTDRLDVIATVEEGNILLRDAISLANDENLARLSTVWQGFALTRAREFVTDIYGRYAKPFDVKFEYIVPPTVNRRGAPGQVVVVSQENWIYQGPNQDVQESFEFTYTLSQENGRWVITRYNYLNLPTPTPTATPAAPATPLVTPTAQ